MRKIILGVEGMMCGMCEAHINDEIRKHYPNVKKVTSNRNKKETIIINDEDINENDLSNIIKDTGYTMTSYNSEEYKKKSLFGF